MVKGIGAVTCMYINPATDPLWIIDYRMYDPDGDGKTRLDHAREVLNNAGHDKQLPFRGVLGDNWYLCLIVSRHVWKMLLAGSPASAACQLEKRDNAPP